MLSKKKAQDVEKEGLKDWYTLYPREETLRAELQSTLGARGGQRERGTLYGASDTHVDGLSPGADSRIW